LVLFASELFAAKNRDRSCSDYQPGICLRLHWNSLLSEKTAESEGLPKCPRKIRTDSKAPAKTIAAAAAIPDRRLILSRVGIAGESCD